MDLVDDHRLHPRQHRGRLAGEHEIERLGSGDKDLGRLAFDARPLARRRVAGAYGHAGQHCRRPGRAISAQVDRSGCRQFAQLGQRAAQVLLHVGCQGLERRHIEHHHAFGGRRVAHKPIDGTQERRQRLARSCRCHRQHVLAVQDGVPSRLLYLRRGLEALGEPLAHQGREAHERTMFLPRSAAVGSR